MDKPVVSNPGLLASAVSTLSCAEKTLDSKWFYDSQGSELFEQITALPEYYLTRTEVDILRARAQQLAALVSDSSVLLELGSGASIKTRILLAAFKDLAAYVPLDISGPFLQSAAAALRGEFPGLDVLQHHLGRPRIVAHRLAVQVDLDGHGDRVR